MYICCDALSPIVGSGISPFPNNNGGYCYDNTNACRPRCILADEIAEHEKKKSHGEESIAQSFQLIVGLGKKVNRY